MGAIRTVSVILLIGVALVAHFTLAKQAEWNGLMDADKIFHQKSRTLANTTIKVNLPKTGIDAFDSYLSFMVSFFWGASDSRNHRARLQANQILGTLGSAWILMLVEGHRSNSSVLFLVLTYIFEIFGELVGIGLWTPIWCAFHLLLTRAPTKANDLRAPQRDFRSLGYALVFGYMLPTIAMAQTKPDGQGLASWQIWTVARLFHPVFVFVLWQVFQLLQGVFSGSTALARSSIVTERQLSVVRKFYVFSILNAAYSHASFLGMLLSQEQLPGWLKEDVVAALDIRSVIVPVAFWGPYAKYSTSNPIPFDIGVATLLQWDNICAASAIFIWAFFLYLESATLAKTGTKLGGMLNVFLQSALVTVLAGPAAAAAYFLLERDATVAGAVSEPEGNKKKQ